MKKVINILFLICVMSSMSLAQINVTVPPNGCATCGLTLNTNSASFFDCDGLTQAALNPSLDPRLQNGQSYSTSSPSVSSGYTNGDGSSYGADAVTVNGLTLTRTAGTYAAGGGTVEYELSGTYTGTTGDFITFTLYEGCSVTWGCGGTITVNHVAGAVAPVTTTITYQTVLATKNEPNKCWLAQNLGATTTASSFTTSTEAAGGWYWQWARRQGWRYAIGSLPSEDGFPGLTLSDVWPVSEDPCSIELGQPWRVASTEEWGQILYRAPTVYNPTDAFSTELMLHAAGSHGDGGRGSRGFYWTRTNGSRTAEPGESAMRIDMYTIPNPDAFGIDTEGQELGFAIRCIYDR